MHLSNDSTSLSFSALSIEAQQLVLNLDDHDSLARHPLVEWFVTDEFSLGPTNRRQWFFQGHPIDSPFS